MRFSGEQSGSAFRASLAFRIMFLFETILRAGILITTPAKLASGWLACLYREGVEPSGSL